jgi:myo-inositol-1-phosphate synthase
MSKVRVAIIGVGNCASALIRGLSQVITKAPSVPPTIVSGFQETGTDVVVNYLPVGA